MNINFSMDRLIDMMMEADQNTREYYKLARQYKKAHGFIPCIDMRHGLDNELIRIYDASKREQEGNNVVWSILEVLGFDQEQRGRLLSVHRAMKRWYEETEWQRLPSEELIERVTRFVVG